MGSDLFFIEKSHCKCPPKRHCKTNWYGLWSFEFDEA